MSRASLYLMLAGALIAATSVAQARQLDTREAHSGSATAMAQPQVAPAGGLNQFASENQAQSHCPGDTVVWVNTKTHVYHFAGNSAFGHTKHGAFMCRADADRAGSFRAAKNEAASAKPGMTGTSTAPRR